MFRYDMEERERKKKKYMSHTITDFYFDHDSFVNFILS
jgi:hypothetical protein